MKLFTKTSFHRQAIILLSAQAPGDQTSIKLFSENIHQLITNFNQYQIGQKIIVLGDKCLIDSDILEDKSWLYAYNSAYQQPVMTSLQRGISLMSQSVHSALIWPANTPPLNSDHIHQILKEQKNKLHNIIRPHDSNFPMCIPHTEFKHILDLKSDLKIDEQLSANAYFVPH
ncbi:MAG: hypothetical protein P8L77_04915 [Gammaproteobacteria bacterium]|nr:hypothetical protein [Gammaproteobacteria bacterium]